MGSDISQNVLPAIVQCPLCQKRRGYVYRDPAFDGQWFYCHDCHAACDMIELAAVMWKISPLNTLRKLKEMGFEIPEAVLVEGATESYERKHIDARRRTRQFWRQALRYFVESADPSLRGLQAHLGVQDHLAPAWQYRGARFIGAADAQEIRGFHLAEQRYESKHARPRRLLFRGQGWKDVIVVPFWDLPGRICGFLYIGRQGREEDIIYHHTPEFVPRGKTGQHHCIEAGITMPLAVLQSEFRHPMFGNTVFVMDDPIMALRLQLRHMRHTQVPLALIGTWDEPRYRTKNVWEWLPTSNVIVWSPAQTTGSLRLAQDAGAKISEISISESELEKNLRHQTPEHWFQRVQQETVPWDEAVRHRLKGLSQIKTEELLLELELTGGNLRKFISGCRGELAESLQHIHDGHTTVRTVHYGKYVIGENEDGWSVQSTVIDTCGRREPSYQICDAVIRIEYILRTSTKRNYYRGFVRFAGQTIPFTEKTETLDKSLWAWLKSLIAQHGLGAPTALSGWIQRLLDIAIRFCQPEVVWSADVVGWDETRRQFNFPDFAIALSGDVVDDHVCLSTGGSIPGQGLIKPAPLGRFATEALSEYNEETQIFWAMAACVANNILAPALYFTPRGILLDGIGAQTIGAAAAVRLGCNEDYTFHIITHRWPTLFSLGMQDWKMIDARLPDGAACQAIFKMPTPTINVLGVRQQWNIVTCHRKLGSMQLVKDVAARVLPAYLKDVCERRFDIPHRYPDETDNILNDMASWFHRQSGDPLTVHRARDVLRVPGRPAGETHFIELLRFLFNEGRLKNVPVDFDDVPESVPKMVESESRDQVWIPQRSVIDLTEAVASIPLDLLPTTKALRECGCLRKEAPRAGKMGWIVDNQWFNRQWKELEAQHVE